MTIALDTALQNPRLLGHSRRAEITTLHEVLWPRVSPVIPHNFSPYLDRREVAAIRSRMRDAALKKSERYMRPHGLSNDP